MTTIKRKQVMKKTATHKIEIHPTAIVHPKAVLGPGVVIGPYSLLGGHVRIGSKTRIGAHCVIEGNTTIGRDCDIFTGAVLGSPPQDLKYKGEPSSLTIGDRNKIREYVTMNTGTADGAGKTIVGNDCMFMAYAHVAHDCLLGDHVVMANSVALGGHIVVEDHAVIGGLVGVHQFVRIGVLAIIGGCSRVIQDVPPYSICVGYPAKVFGVNAEGLKRAGVSKNAKEHLHRAFRILFRSKHAISRATEEVAQNADHCVEVQQLVSFIRNSKRGICRA